MQSDPMGADEAAMLYATAAAALQTPRGSAGSGQLSFSSTSSSSTSGSCASTKSAVSECLSAWLNYFQILNGLCSSGYRLAQTIAVLEQWGELPPPASSTSSSSATSAAAAASPPQLQQQQQQRCSSSCGSAASSNAGSGGTAAGVSQYVTAWDDLARATAVATSTVKSHIVNVLQDFVTPFAPALGTDHLGSGASVPGCTSATATFGGAAAEAVDLQRLRELNQQIICETTQTMINIQHQFCVASYESFSTSMCCFVCQAPVGCAHDDGCAMLMQSTTAAGGSGSGGSGSTLPQPHHLQHQQQQQQYSPKFGAAQFQPTSSECIAGFGGDNIAPPPPIRGSSPPVHGQPPPPAPPLLPQAAFFDTATRGGPLPQPGNLLGMKAPFVHRGGSRSPLNCPLFPLSTQRRWSEAAASGAVADAAALLGTALDGGRGAGGGGSGGGSSGSAGGAGGGGGASGGADGGDGSMRRWSMPWEALAPGRTVGGGAMAHQQQQQHASNLLVAWHQTRAGPVAGGMRGAMGAIGTTTASQSSSNRSDRSHSITPDSVWHSGSSQETDGLAEAIQLLTLRPTQRPAMAHPVGQQQQPPPNIGPAFIEESSQSFFTSLETAPVYEMWSDTPSLMPCIKFNNDLDDGHRRNK